MKRFLLSVCLVLCATGVSAGVFPYANLTGYSTQLVAVNTTSETIQWGGPYAGIGSPNFIAPHRWVTFDRYPAEGGGVVNVTAPEGLELYVEITVGEKCQLPPSQFKTESCGHRVRVYSLEPIDFSTRWFPNLLGPFADGYQAFLFVAAPEGAWVSVSGYGSDYAAHREPQYIEAGDVWISPLWTDGTPLVSVTSGLRIGGGSFPQGPVYAFVLMSHQPDGALVVEYGHAD